MYHVSFLWVCYLKLIRERCLCNVRYRAWTRHVHTFCAVHFTFINNVCTLLTLFVVVCSVFLINGLNRQERFHTIRFLCSCIFPGKGLYQVQHNTKTRRSVHSGYVLHNFVKTLYAYGGATIVHGTMYIVQNNVYCIVCCVIRGYVYIIVYGVHFINTLCLNCFLIIVYTYICTQQERCPRVKI